MASVLTWPSGRSFTYTVTKVLVANPARSWVNRYECISIASGTLDDLILLGRALALLELDMHPTQVYFQKWEVATGARDGRPYNPESFYEESINQAGYWSRGGHSIVDLDVTLWLERFVLTGRTGKIFYRGILGEEDIEAGAGKFLLTGTTMRDRLSLAVTFSSISDYYANGANTKLRLCLIGPNGEYPRLIGSINVHGVNIFKTNHRYFDRRAVTPELPPYVVGEFSEPDPETIALADNPVYPESGD
jgi:hypothetical protein